MILLVDAGNTRLKWRFVESSYDVNQELSAGALDLGGLRRFSLLISEARRSVKNHRLARVIVACVAGEDVSETLTQIFVDEFAIEPEFVHVKRKLAGLTAGYETLSNLGVDRWLNMLAYVDRYPAQNGTVVSLGTAITVDWIDSEANHRGGLIVPGVSTMLSALNLKANALQAQTLNVSRFWMPGCDTLDCINEGFSVLLKGFFDQIGQFQNGKFAQNIILTGGDAPLVQCLSEDFVYQEGLVMSGLSIYAKEIERVQEK